MNEKNTIIGACDFSITVLQDIKKSIITQNKMSDDFEVAKSAVMITLAANLIKICYEVMTGSDTDRTGNSDILKIKSQFNNFIDKMINTE